MINVKSVFDMEKRAQKYQVNYRGQVRRGKSNVNFFSLRSKADFISFSF